MGDISKWDNACHLNEKFKKGGKKNPLGTQLLTELFHAEASCHAWVMFYSIFSVIIHVHFPAVAWQLVMLE